MEITENTQNVNEESTDLDEAARQNVETGVWLLCKEMLVTAIQDIRLQRPHLRVLAAYVTFINKQSAKAWPSREAIASVTGLSPRNVSNILLELRTWGYMVGARQNVQEANNKRLTVYTFGNIDHEQIRKGITEFVNKVKLARSTPHRVNKSSSQEVKYTAGLEPSSSSQGVTDSASSTPQAVDSSSPHRVDSNYIDRNSIIGGKGEDPYAVAIKVKDALFKLRSPNLVAGSAGLENVSAIVGWIEGGLSPKLDVYAAIKAELDALAHKNSRQRIQSWEWFRNTVAKAYDLRTRALPTGQQLQSASTGTAKGSSWKDAEIAAQNDAISVLKSMRKS